MTIFSLEENFKFNGKAITQICLVVDSLGGLYLAGDVETVKEKYLTEKKYLLDSGLDKEYPKELFIFDTTNYTTDEKRNLLTFLNYCTTVSANGDRVMKLIKASPKEFAMEMKVLRNLGF